MWGRLAGALTSEQRWRGASSASANYAKREVVVVVPRACVAESGHLGPPTARGNLEILVGIGLVSLRNDLR